MPSRQKSEPQPAFIESFQALYREKKYPHAFIIASKYPQLKTTPEYTKMQEHFQSLLRLAALHIKRDEVHKAQELIGEYSRVEEKRIIVRLLLKHGEKFFHFLKALNDKDLKEIFEIAESYPDFAKVPSFTALKLQMQEDLAVLEKKMDAMELDEDFSLLWRWEAFLPEAKKMQTKLALLQQLYSHYQEERWDACYTMIAKEPLLADSILTQLLQKHWYKCFERAKEYAKKGDIQSLYQTLSDFKAVTSKQDQIKQLLYIATKRYIADLIQRHEFDIAERLLFEAVERFGKQAELTELAKLYYKESGIKVVF